MFWLVRDGPRKSGKQEVGFRKKGSDATCWAQAGRDITVWLTNLLICYLLLCCAVLYCILSLVLMVMGYKESCILGVIC